ncbi:MAG: hypothetical protein WD010_10445 [Nitriliruptor sp.]|uniref:hypothetical protein n=1 Tax=Nitriliruptor sp. TaxID=2448056 RepID=UPI0034A0454F
MYDIKVTTTPGSLRAVPKREDAALDEVIGRVRERGGQRTPDEVYAQLLREVKVAFPAGFFPNGTRLRDVAHDIAEAS